MSPTDVTTQPLRRILLMLGATIIVLMVCGYVLLQARLIITGPNVTIEETSIVHSDRTVTLKGQARNIAKITLNGRTIYTDEQGYFEEAVVLENGYTIATLEAADRYGRKTSIEQPLVYSPQTRVQ